MQMRMDWLAHADVFRQTLQTVVIGTRVIDVDGLHGLGRWHRLIVPHVLDGRLDHFASSMVLLVVLQTAQSTVGTALFWIWYF